MLFTLLLLAVLAGLLHGALLPGCTLFSNDGPLGRLMSQSHRLPQTFTGAWQDLNATGFREGGAAPNLSYGLRLLLQPIWFSKVYALAGLLFLGGGAWCFFRQLRLHPAACALAGLAAALNSSFFSAACWGVASHAITIGCCFFALAALADTSSPRRWLRVMLAGLSVGMAVSEGADIGAMFSVYVAGFVLYQALVAEGPLVKRLATGTARVAVLAALAAFLAAQSLSVLVSTQIEGIAGTQQDEESREHRWNWATQWSLPKRELLGLAVPGLFGYRADTPGGGEYWGGVGRDAAWTTYFANGKQGPRPTGFIRYGAGSIYAGTPVLLVAVWAGVQSLRRKGSVFNPTQRKWLWFWMVAAFISVLLGFGRYAPFYRWLYALPYLSTVRNPSKFYHVVSFAIVIGFAYGVDGLWRNYVQPAGVNLGARWMGLGSWWSKASRFDRRWVQGCLLVLGLGLFGWMLYNSARPALERYLLEVEFPPARAAAIAGFSVREVGWFLLFYVLAAGLLLLLLSGAFAGRRARWGAAWLGALLVADLARAHQPWIQSWNYVERYASNPIIDRLRQEPYQQRVATLPRWFLRSQFQDLFRVTPRLESQERLFYGFYEVEWSQHQFPCYNIQSLDVTQMPRKPQDILAFDEALSPRRVADLARVLTRRWELTNTRYVLGAAGFLNLLNSFGDPDQTRFSIVERFTLVPRPGILRPMQAEDLMAEESTNGPFALFEFTGALPRASLYGRWRAATNNAQALDLSTNSNFHPAQEVVVAGLPATAPAPGTNTEAGTVEIQKYAPKAVSLRAQVSAPAVLLLNDRFDPNWKAFVDGAPSPVLHCNYLMRGVFLTPGPHLVEFRFEPPFRLLYVSLAAIGLGVVLLGVVVVWEHKSQPQPVPTAQPPAGSTPGPPPAKANNNGRAAQPPAKPKAQPGRPQPKAPAKAQKEGVRSR